MLKLVVSLLHVVAGEGLERPDELLLPFSDFFSAVQLFLSSFFTAHRYVVAENSTS